MTAAVFGYVHVSQFNDIGGNPMIFTIHREVYFKNVLIPETVLAPEENKILLEKKSLRSPESQRQVFGSQEFGIIHRRGR
jgi:hypothetical protein